MKQLLTWCGTRALGERPAVTGKDRDAVLAGLFPVQIDPLLDADA